MSQNWLCYLQTTYQASKWPARPEFHFLFFFYYNQLQFVSVSNGATSLQTYERYDSHTKMCEGEGVYV